MSKWTQFNEEVCQVDSNVQFYYGDGTAAFNLTLVLAATNVEDLRMFQDVANEMHVDFQNCMLMQQDVKIKSCRIVMDVTDLTLVVKCKYIFIGSVDAMTSQMQLVLAEKWMQH